MPIYLVNAPNMANINYQIAYNSAVARAEGDVAKGPFPPGALLAANPGKTGVVLVGVARKDGASGPGPNAYIGFRAAGKPGDRTELTASVSRVDDPNGTAIPIDRIHGSITILGPNGGLPGDCDNDHVLTTADAMCALRMSVNLRPADLNLDKDTDGRVTSRDATLIQQATVV